MAEIVARQKPLLKSAGFRRRGNTFNRRCDEQIVHVVKFWMAPHEPSAWTEVPGLRERHYGSFRIDFGIYFRGRRDFRPDPEAWVRDEWCPMRFTMGELAALPDEERWWSLSDPRASTNSSAMLLDHGLPYLDRYQSVDDVVSAFEHLGPFPLGLSPAGGLDVADLCMSTGHRARAREILEDYVSRPVHFTHVDILVAYLIERGHQDLVSRIIPFGAPHA
jgi:hypothetical protein